MSADSTPIDVTHTQLGNYLIDPPATTDGASAIWYGRTKNGTDLFIVLSGETVGVFALSGGTYTLRGTVDVGGKLDENLSLGGDESC